MKKFLIAVAAAVIGTAAQAQIPGLNQNNSQGIITADSANPAMSCVVGTSPTCSVPIIPWAVLTVSTTRANGSVSTANTFQTALASAVGRKGCLLMNTSAVTMLVDVSANPASSTAMPLPAGARFSCANEAGAVINDTISVTSGTVGATYVVWYQ